MTEGLGNTGPALLFGLALLLKCALAGAVIGGAVAAVQIFPGRWHPVWANNLLYWFSCPFSAGFAGGVLLALKSIPAQREGRVLWLLLCLVIGSCTAIVAAGAVAYFSRNHDEGTANKSKRATRRHTGRRPSRTPDWENRLRSLFQPAKELEKTQVRIAPQTTTKAAASTPGQKAKLPGPRFPAESQLATPIHYAGHPRKILPVPGKLEKPLKGQQAKPRREGSASCEKVTGEAD